MCSFNVCDLWTWHHFNTPTAEPDLIIYICICYNICVCVCVSYTDQIQTLFTYIISCILLEPHCVLMTYSYCKFNIFTAINCHSFIQDSDFSQELTIGYKNTHNWGTPNNAEKLNYIYVLLPSNHKLQNVAYIYMKYGNNTHYVAVTVIPFPPWWQKRLMSKFNCKKNKTKKTF